MKKNLILCGAVLALSAASLQANDGSYYTSGNHLVPLQETDISIRSEVLTISISESKYAFIDVNYTFYNPGETTKKILMGFETDPSYNEDYQFHPDGVNPFIKDFTVEMNGRKLSYKNAPCYADSIPFHKVNLNKEYEIDDAGRLMEKDRRDPYESVEFAYVYYFEAEFKPGLNKVHHTYSYHISNNIEFPYIVTYKLTPAARWAGGKIGDFTLIVRIDKTAKHFRIFDTPFPDPHYTVIEGAGKFRPNVSSWTETPYHEFSVRNGAIRLNLKDYAPQAEFEICAMAPIDYEDTPLGITYDRSFPLWIAEAQDMIEDDDFLKRIARNLPYANRGHVFKDARLKAYFESLWWYMPDPKYKDSTSDFTKVDWMWVNGKTNW